MKHSKNKIPWFLEYFLEDILGGDFDISTKKMFWWYGIFKYQKIFAFYSDGEFYFRKNIYNENEEANRFHYNKKWEKVELPYYKISEDILENRDLLEEYIDASLDY